MSATQYCVAGTCWCFTISDWSEIATIVAAIVTVPSALFAAYKTFHEIQKGQQLKRTEFTLAQHRRLFDDPTLYSVLGLIDGDDTKLKETGMWDAKRKFLTFFEEIELLVSSGDISKNVAYYMFGYYAKCALEGENFGEGINLKPEYWGLFFKFASDSSEYLKESFDPKKLSL